jgi:hypothetical protein
VPNSVLLVVVVLRRNSIDRDDNFESTLSGLTPRGDDGPLSSLSNHDQRGNAFVLDDLFQIGIYRRTPDVFAMRFGQKDEESNLKNHCQVRNRSSLDHCATTLRDP